MSSSVAFFAMSSWHLHKCGLRNGINITWLYNQLLTPTVTGNKTTCWIIVMIWRNGGNFAIVWANRWMLVLLGTMMICLWSFVFQNCASVASVSSRTVPCQLEDAIVYSWVPDLYLSIRGFNAHASQNASNLVQVANHQVLTPTQPTILSWMGNE